MSHTEQNANEAEPVDDRLDRRMLIKAAAGGVVAGGLVLAAPAAVSVAAEAQVPNNFHALIHVTNQEGMQYAFSALQTMSDHYSKAKGRLVIDGSAVGVLADKDGLASLESVSKKDGIEIFAASDALEINQIDTDSVPDFIDASNTGIIAVIDAQIKGYHYYKL